MSSPFPGSELELPGEEEEQETGPPVRDPAPARAEATHQVDPTQRLLTALGRFQRQIARARDGQSDDIWSDECMTQLVNGIEVALDQSWKEVVTTLTETARILQSYIDEKKASRCIPFLGDSYEILCLMVGDLIVGKVRSGVVDKWETRYQRALEELQNDGVPLIQDEEDTAQPVAASAPIRQQEPVSSQMPEPPFPEEEPLEEEDASFEDLNAESVTKAAERTLEQIEGATRKLNEIDQAVDSLFSEFDAEDETRPEATPSEIDSDSDEEQETLPLFAPKYEEEPVTPVFEVEDLDESWDDVMEEQAPPATPSTEETASPFKETTMLSIPDEVAAEVDRAVASMAPQEEDSDEVVAPWETGELASSSRPTIEEVLPEAEQTPDEEPTGVTSSGRLPDSLVELLDSLCENLSMLAIPETDFASTVAYIKGILAELETSARERDEERAVLPCLAMGRMVRLVAEQQALPDERFLDLAYAFCGLYAEAGEETQMPALQHWLRECDALLVNWAALAREQAMRHREAVVAPSQAAPVPESEASLPEEPETEEPEEEEPVLLEPLAPLEPLHDAEPEEALAEGRLESLDPLDVEEEPTATVEPTPPGVDEILDVLDGAKARLEPPLGGLTIPPATTEDAREKPARDSADGDYHSPGSLLETASRAVSEGNVSNAKVLAMQAATRIAEAQAREAEARVEQAELRLKRGTAEAEQARIEVHQAEQSVLSAEERVVECERDLGRRREELETVSSQAGHIQALIKEIDDQIRALQHQREDAVRRKVTTETDLTQKQTALAQGQKELERRKSAEMESRVALEDLRQQVKVLERKRVENEAVMERTREMLNRQRASLIEMEKMISLICSNETNGMNDADEEMLF